MQSLIVEWNRTAFFSCTPTVWAIINVFNQQLLKILAVAVSSKLISDGRSPILILNCGNPLLFADAVSAPRNLYLECRITTADEARKMTIGWPIILDVPLISNWRFNHISKCWIERLSICPANLILGSQLELDASQATAPGDGHDS